MSTPRETRRANDLAAFREAMITHGAASALEPVRRPVSPDVFKAERKERFMEASKELAQELEIDRTQLVGLLRAAYEEKEQRDTAGRNFDNFAKLFKDYLDRNPEEVLYDGESGIEARYEERRMPGGPAVDLISLREHNPVLFERLFQTGCLSVNNKALEAQGVQVEGWKRYSTPAGMTKALKLGPVKQ